MRRAKKIRTTVAVAGGNRAADLLDRDFTATAPNRVWITDFTYVRSWAGFVYVAFIVDVFAQRIVAWHAASTKMVDLVMTPLRMALWQRDHEGHPTIAGELIHHSDAGSQGGFNWSSQHLDRGGVQQWRRRTGPRRRVMCPRVRVGNGARIGRCVRRCVRRGGLSPRGRFSGSFGV